ncbi:MAG: glycosyltransferase family 4 protein [Vicingaceae bacterium]|nr:glycosyltransferase family 4 protein [Vicingaceae bacterium]
MDNIKNILYFYPLPTTFILRDIEILNQNYNVIPYEFKIKVKWKTPFEFFKQFFFLLLNIRKTDVLMSHFAGYNSLLPAIFGKLFNKPCLIIVAGNDGSKFPDFNYGNYTKKLLGFCTGKSLQLATHILPVHESLVYQDYNYYEGGMPTQGYTHFYPKAKKIPFTPVYYGYDIDFFKPNPTVVRKKNSFITIGNLNDNYAFKRKGFDMVIALAKLRPELSFTLVGWDGVKKIEVPDNVELHRYVPINEVPTLFSQHEFYFQLSIMEGFPNALAEAMSCGCIPIGSNVSGIPFIIGETGYILNKRDVNLLSNLVDEALIDTRREKLPLLARKRIVENFTYEDRKKMFIKIISGAYEFY